MNALPAAEIRKDVLSQQRCEWRNQLGQRKQDICQRLVSGQFVLRHAASPEPVARTANVPVAQLIDKAFDRLRRIDEVVHSQAFIHDKDQAV
ncbi:hypothetical protein D3C76_1729610 [compost metagenome]